MAVSEDTTRRDAATAAKKAIPVPWMALQEDRVSSIPPVFTQDGSYVFLVQETSVLIVSRATNRVVAILSGDSTDEEHRHTAPITDMLLSPFNPLQLLTCSLDGTVKTWDYLDSELHDNVHVGHAIVGMTASVHWKQRLFVAVCKRDAGTSKDASSTMYSVQLGRSSPRMHKATKLVRLGKTRPVSNIAVSPDGRWLVVTSGTKVHVLSLHDTGAGFTKFATESALTALAFDPDVHFARFATGEANGKIKIWHCLEAAQHGEAPRDAAAATTTLHWHAHAVEALEYTPDGAHLLSGGEESVLVLWKLSSGSVDGREFVPRLGAPIVAIGVAHGYENAEQEYVVRLADGSAVFIASLSLKPARTFSSIKCPGTSVANFNNMPMALDRGAGHMALLSGHPSTLQFIDIATRTHLRDMEIVPSNRVSRPDEAPLMPPRVYNVAFSAPARDVMQAEWMATVDGRDGGAYTTELSLKLWQWDVHSRTYLLNTRIDHPHEHSVTSVAFSPRLGDALDAFLLVTTGADGQVKTWRLAERQFKGGRTEVFWVCRSSFAYRETTPHAAVWAPDGSLLAIAQGMFVTLWDPQTLVMQARLASPELRDVRACIFTGRKGRFIAALGMNAQLLIWDLVSQTVVWRASEAVLGASHHLDGLLTLRHVTSDGGAPVTTALDYVRPATGVVCTYTVPVELRPGVLDVSRGSDPSELHLLAQRASGALVAIGAAATMAMPRAASLQGVAMGDGRATLFDELFGVEDSERERVAEVLDTDAQRLHKGVEGTTSAATLELFSTPAHLLPPVSTLLDAYIDALLPPAPTQAPDVALSAPHEGGAGESMPLPLAPPRLDAVDHVAHARDADISYLTAVFDRLMSVEPQPRAARAPRADKSKRPLSRSSS